MRNSPFFSRIQNPRTYRCHMKFSFDYESLLLAFSLFLSLLAYVSRRQVSRSWEKNQGETRPGREKNEPAPGNGRFFLEGFLKKKENIFVVSGIAWVLFSLYILSTILRDPDDFYGSDGFYSDVIFLVFPLYLAYHEYVSWRNRKDYAGLRFINGLFAISMIIYLVVYSVPALAGAVIYFSAYKASALLTLLGYHTQASSVDFGGNDGLLRENELFISSGILRTGQTDLVDVNLTCAAFPSLVIFFALALLSRKDVRTRAKALLVIPVIHLLNVVRISALAYVLYTEKMDYLLAHNYISRALSLIALFFLFSYFFRLLPDVHKDFLSGLSIHRKHRIKKEREKEVGASSSN